MPLMTLDRWRDKTSKWNSDRKNPLITDLDILIAEYHKPTKTDLQKLKLLILIRHYCREWLSEKSDKKACFRREYVDELRDQTTELLQGADMQQAMQQQKAGGNQPKKGKQMEENIVEMIQPRATAKDKYGLSANLEMPRVSAPTVEHSLPPQFDRTDLIAVLDHIQDQQKKGNMQRNLEYLQKNDRLKCRLQHWQTDGLFHRGGSDMPHGSPGSQHELYAIDQMEFIYTANQPAKSGTFHHSSFLSGKPVLCAGEIQLQQGVIVHIDNGSGHYKPRTQDLLNCVELLRRRYSVDLAKVKIQDFSQQTAQWSSAAQFLLRKGSPPIIGQGRV